MFFQTSPGNGYSQNQLEHNMLKLENVPVDALQQAVKCVFNYCDWILNELFSHWCELINLQKSTLEIKTTAGRALPSEWTFI